MAQTEGTLVVLLLLCALALSSADPETDYPRGASLTPRDMISEQSMLLKHNKWMYKHGVSYETEEVKEERFLIFKENVQLIERHNEEGSHTYRLGINQFAGLTNAEFVAMYGGNPKPSLEITSAILSSFEYNNVKEVPPSLDWRDYNAVTPVREQRTCG